MRPIKFISSIFIISLVFLPFVLIPLARGEVGVTDDEIVVGSILDLSSHLAFLGNEILTGSNFYLNYINERGGIHGRKIKMVVEDDRTQPPLTLAAAKKLIERDRVFCLFISLSQVGTDSIIPIMEEKKIPLVCPVSQNSGIYTPPKRFIFHFNASTEIQGRGAIEVIVNVLSKKDAKIGCLIQDDLYGQDIMKGVKSWTQKYGIQLTNVETYRRGSMDFSPQLQKLREAAANFIILATITRETVQVFKQSKDIGYDPQFIGPSATTEPIIVKLAGEAAEGFIGMNFIEWDYEGFEPGKLYLSLKKKIEADRPDSFYKRAGFFWAMALVEALDRAGKNLTREGLVTALEGFKNYTAGGLCAPITFGPQRRQGMTSLYFLQVKNGKFVRISDWIDLSK